MKKIWNGVEWVFDRGCHEVYGPIPMPTLPVEFQGDKLKETLKEIKKKIEEMNEENEMECSCGGNCKSRGKEEEVIQFYPVNAPKNTRTKATEREKRLIMAFYELAQHPDTSKAMEAGIHNLLEREFGIKWSNIVYDDEKMFNFWAAGVLKKRAEDTE